MRVIRVFICCLLVVALTLFAVGCGGSGSDDSSKDSEPGGTINEMEQEANEAAREANLRTIDSAIQTYYATNGTYPTDISQLSTYFVRGIPRDPMGGTYYIVVQGGEAKAAVK